LAHTQGSVLPALTEKGQRTFDNWKQAEFAQKAP
jgi:hypothetical protein